LLGGKVLPALGHPVHSRGADHAPVGNDAGPGRSQPRHAWASARAARSRQALADLLGGKVQVMFGTLPQSMEYIRTDKVRALAVTTRTPSPTLPDLPPISDFVPGYETSSWAGIGAPRNTPTQIIDRLNTEINVPLADPKLIARFADLGLTPLAGSPADFGKLIADETEKWGKVIRAANIKAD
jgi:tripartite-type tricarboxylate transporter receptor subunit TctC